MHRWAYIQSCCQGVCLLSVGELDEVGLVGRAFLAEFREVPAVLPASARAVKRLPCAQSTHHTLFDDLDQWACLPTSNFLAHSRQRPAYFSEIRRRSLGSSTFRLSRILISTSGACGKPGTIHYSRKTALAWIAPSAFARMPHHTAQRGALLPENRYVGNPVQPPITGQTRVLIPARGAPETGASIVEPS